MKKQSKKKFLKKAARRSEAERKRRRAKGEQLAALPAGVEDCRRPMANEINFSHSVTSAMLNRNHL